MYATRNMVLLTGRTHVMRLKMERRKNVYVLDLERSVRTCLADSPLEYTTFVSVVSGDHFVIHGDLDGLRREFKGCRYDHGAEMSALNLKENV